MSFITNWQKIKKFWINDFFNNKFFKHFFPSYQYFDQCGWLDWQSFETISLEDEDENALETETKTVPIQEIIGTEFYKKRLVPRLNPSLLLKINLCNMWTLQLNKVNQMKLYKNIIRSPA